MPSATSTLDAIGAVIVGTAVDLGTIIYTEYWPYLIVFAVLVILAGAVTGFLYSFGRRGRG